MKYNVVSTKSPRSTPRGIELQTLIETTEEADRSGSRARKTTDTSPLRRPSGIHDADDDADASADDDAADDAADASADDAAADAAHTDADADTAARAHWVFEGYATVITRRPLLWALACAAATLATIGAGVVTLAPPDFTKPEKVRNHVSHKDWASSPLKR